MARLDSIFIVYPRSGTTIVQFGLQDEVFNLPALEIPTVVYQGTDDEGNVQYRSSASTSSSGANDTDSKPLKEVRPIVDGEIVDLEAFLYFLKLIYISILADKHKNDPDAFDRELSNVPLLLISHYKWSAQQIEKINQHVFEILKLNSFLMLPTSLAATHAMAALQNSIVIDIGKTHTDILPIVDYSQLTHFSSTIPIGGNDINTHLKSILPSLSDDQIEDLKLSNIYEVLNAEAKKNYADLHQADEDEDDSAIDVAAIITSGRDAREILEGERKNKNENSLPNSELDKNSFVDRNGQLISVGKQRFQGCENLIKAISKRVGYTISMVQDINKQKAMWENIVIVGNTSLLTGFQDSLLTKLMDDNLVIEPQSEQDKRQQDAMDSAATSSKKKSKYMGTNFVPTIEYQQVPTSIKLAKAPEYFPEWKKNKYANIVFLGGMIVARQVFTHSKVNFFINRDNYNENGPASYWDINL
ncbi:hypothetical protein TPHA_0N01430 [Tetrapisispora phaffii CBS 4417]|uniref:Actin-like protein ARP9 n=1 Tax=Tetrapisispora phaffii (strain ATCC 24235 / CBS 4417 / NBRC 1672 / NRRL Y-8282 / UCD 70-5) TaxID=1071381 RepID=G8C196_TETPH|nr:hypothetical protein TPHA_0N01430 [Tetrapisispora phaffii CBS 4417]CCE65924.1 hypothetical protein TPHA_0N01430 [Tetrapisispora phaffii CBS 4417]